MSDLIDIANAILARKPQKYSKDSPPKVAAEQNLEIFDTTVIYIDDPSQVLGAITHLLLDNRLLGLDIETYPLPNYLSDEDAGLTPRKSAIRLLQIYDGKQSVFIFDLLKMGGIHTLPEALWQHSFVAHNAMFELKHLLHAGAIPQKLGCTLLVDRVRSQGPR